VQEDAQGSLSRLGIAIEDIGQHELRNIQHTVHIYRVLLDRAAAIPKYSPPIPDRPSIAVLPFQNLSGDPAQAYLPNGMVEDIVTELSRFSELFVIARNSSFQYKDKAIDVRQVGRELGVRCVLEGSVRRIGDRIRISAQLIAFLEGAGGSASYPSIRHEHGRELVVSVQSSHSRKPRVEGCQQYLVLGLD
jgi:adenylate cyclase